MKARLFFVLYFLYLIVLPTSANEMDVFRGDTQAKIEHLQRQNDELKSELKDKVKDSEYQKDFAHLKDLINNQNSNISWTLGMGGILVTILLGFLVYLGFISVKSIAKESADKWFTEHTRDLENRIKELELQATKHKQTMEQVSEGVQAKAEAVKIELNEIQNTISAQSGKMKDGVAELEHLGKAIATPALDQAVKELNKKPPSEYQFADWNNLAYESYVKGNFNGFLFNIEKAIKSDNASPSQILVTMLNRGIILGQLGRTDDALAQFDQLIRAYRKDERPEIRESVARAMLNRGVTLGKMGRTDEALAQYDQLIQTYRNDERFEIRESVARAMLNRGVTLGQQGRTDDALAQFDQLIRAYRKDERPEIRESVARAMMNRGFTLGKMGRTDEALEQYDELIQMYRKDERPEIRESVARAMLNRGFTLGKMGRTDEALEQYDELIQTYRKDECFETREMILSAVLNLYEQSIISGKTLSSVHRGIFDITIKEQSDQLMFSALTLIEQALSIEVTEALANMRVEYQGESFEEWSWDELDHWSTSITDVEAKARIQHLITVFKHWNESNDGTSTV